MAELLATLQAAQITARKAQDKERTLVLGTLIAEVKNRALASNQRLEDADVLEVLRKGITQRRDAAKQFSDASRSDLANRESAQAKVLEEFLPLAIDPEEVRGAVGALIAAGTTAMGPLMGALVPRFKGRIDGKALNQIVREELQPG